MTAEKDVQVARKKGRGGEEVIWAMPERKHFFFHEVFPYYNRKIRTGGEYQPISIETSEQNFHFNSN